jgi:hypothetical protein
MTAPDPVAPHAEFWASLDEHRSHPLFDLVLPGDADALADSIGEPYENLLARYGQMQPYVLDRADEARKLLGTIA